MLKTYEATLSHGQIHWNGDVPSCDSAKVIVTLLSEKGAFIQKNKRVPPAQFAGKVKECGDVMHSLSNKDWGLQ